MIYKNLFIGFVIACVVMLANEINCQQQRPQQTPQQLLQQMQQQIQQRPQQQRPQQKPQQQRPQQQRPRPQQPQQQRPRPQPQQLPSQQQPQQQQQCSPRAGSCQQNSDCCSTSCLLQRCQRSVAEIQQEIALGYSGTNIPFWDTPGSKRYNNLDDLLGSIYEEDGTNTRDNIRTTGANRPAGNNIQPGFNNNRPAAVSDPNDIRLLNNNRLGSNRNLPVSNSLGSRFGGNDSTDQQTSGQCAEIGTRCTRGLECCSTRCHGFLHKCVV